MSWDKPGHGDSPDEPERLDKNGERPFPGAPLDRDPVPAPKKSDLSWDRVKADKHTYTSQSEYEAVLRQRREAAEAKEAEARDAPPKTEAAPDAKPDETTALRSRVAELEADKTRQEHRIALQDRKISRLELDKTELASEVSGLRTELTDRKAADRERDWKDRARDDKIAEQDNRIEELASRIGETDRKLDRRPDSDENVPDKPAASEIDQRDRGSEGQTPEKVKPTRGRILPSGEAISFGVAIAGGAETVLDRAAHVPGTYAGIAAGVLGLGSAGIAWWRSRRKQEKESEG